MAFADVEIGGLVSGRLAGFAILIVLLSLTLACGNGTDSASSNSPRTYNGSSSVGDFVTITVDPSTRTITYKDLSNQDSGTVPYEVNDDGSYRLNDPNGNLVAAYEAPNTALLIESTQAGPSHDELALIVAVPTRIIDPPAWAGQSYNYMQFRTSGGGLEVGSFSFDSEGSLTLAGFSPYRSISGTSAYRRKTLSMTAFQADSSGNFLSNLEDDGTYDYVFGQGNRMLAVDTPEGTTLGLKTRLSKNFDSSFAGEYKAFYYHKEDVRMSGEDEELGRPSLDDATVWTSPSGQLIAKDSAGGILLVATLRPAAEANYLGCGAGCNGLFTFRLAQANFQQDVFVAFTENTVVFSSFRAALPWNARRTYEYMYGVGLK